MSRKITTPEMDEFIHSHYKGTGHRAMAEMVNERFGTSFTAEQIKGYYSRNKLNSGLTGYFQHGHTPHNKDKCWDEWMSPESQTSSRKTCFRKGENRKHAPVGTMRLRYEFRNKTGERYWFIKTAQPSVWRPAHIVEWEKHNGPVPKGSIVRFVDGDTLNWHIDNLVVMTRAQHGVINHQKLKAHDRESMECLKTMVDLRMTIKKKSKRKRR